MVVLDASAVLAVINGEAGAEVVERLLDQAAISAVNLSEVAGKLIDKGVPDADAYAGLAALQLDVHPFDEAQAFAAAGLRKEVPAHLAFGDRACLALARTLRATAVTADRHWGKLKVGAPGVQLIR